MAKIGTRVEAESKQTCGYQGLGEGWGREGNDNGYRVSFEDGENILKLIMVMATQLCKYTKTH